MRYRVHLSLMESKVVNWINVEDDTDIIDAEIDEALVSSGECRTDGGPRCK